MAYRSITKRWIINSLGVILLVLVVVTLTASLMIHNYYYTSMERELKLRADYGDSQVQDMSAAGKANLNAEIRNLVEAFEDKDKMEMMAVDHNGNIIVTSSGFSYFSSYDMPDYAATKEDPVGRGTRVYKLEGTNEKVMAMTVVLPVFSGDVSAVRYVISLENVDRTILTVILILCGVMVLILALILVTSSYFIRSIVIPVQEVGTVARGFATGDMSARILKRSDDEIGELCDIINYMADEIQNSEKMKNEFISSVSHELRTPLTAIKGWGETLMTMGPDDRQMVQRGMHVILNETERLSNMVEELLDFSRIQNGRFTLVKTRIDILAELGDAVLMYTERARRDAIHFEYSEPENVSYVFGDKNRLKQVFINVIDNALKYSDRGDTVRVSVKEEDGFIEIRVQDTGCGIAAEDLPKVKEKFYKANSTRRGSGIGLAVANEIVQLHDGTLTVESELDVGTTVIIRIPVMAKDTERPTQITTGESEPNQ
ncbi:sensor histidine kinase [Massiliimalia timonensis]|uniref:sensor histidine kinase n=1 Tax=Massiliimalia timonensis TaxID=1987501 RepID=UPI000B8B6F36|nr:HAMP domain-containing sensor histidine kinase [Massiliimalia timonensis]